MTNVHELDAAGVLHPDYLPYNDTTTDIPPTKRFDFVDPALRADPALPVFHQPAVVLENITPNIGVKVTGLQLADLDSAGLDQLGLLSAQRGFVIFASSPGMKQSYTASGMERQLDIARHFGVLHRHSTLPHPVATDEISVVYSDPKNTYIKSQTTHRLSGTLWHHDQSHEAQPPGVTFFACMEGPPVGGDTIFADCEEAYERLSPPFQSMLKQLRMVHSSVGHAVINTKIGSANRQVDVETAHPLVREHPVTGKHSLFLGKHFVTSIQGFKEEESRLIINFLYHYIAQSQDLQARVRWNTGDVCVWDQRVVMHSATVDTEPIYRRHFIRITPLAGIPVPADAAGGTPEGASLNGNH